MDDLVKRLLRSLENMAHQPFGGAFNTWNTHSSTVQEAARRITDLETKVAIANNNRQHQLDLTREAHAHIKTLQAEVARLKRIVEVVANPRWKPDELISDGGHEAMDLLRHEAQRALGSKSDDNV